MADNTTIPESSSQNRLLSAVGLFGCVVIFAALLFITYIPDRGAAPRVSKFLDDNGQDPPLASALRDADQETATTYAWIDQDKGIVRIPVQRAVELVVEELPDAN